MNFIFIHALFSVFQNKFLLKLGGRGDENATKTFIDLSKILINK